MTTHHYSIKGIHCSACKMLIEDIVADIAEINHVTVDETQQLLSITTPSLISTFEWMARLSAPLKPFNYSLSLL